MMVETDKQLSEEVTIMEDPKGEIDLEYTFVPEPKTRIQIESGGVSGDKMQDPAE